MKRSTLFLLLAVLVIASVVLAACPSAAPVPAEPTAAGRRPPEPAATPEPPTATPEPAPTEVATVAPTEAPTEAPATAAAGEPIAFACEEPIKIGLITDLTGGLAIYGTMTNRSFLLGMEYASGAPGTEIGPNAYSYKFGECEVQVLVRDDKGSAEETATVARELIEKDQVDMLVGTVSSGSTATLQEIAKESDKVLIVAPAAANDITGANFNEYTFRTSRENYQDFINLCEYLTTQYKKFIQIAPDYSFGYGGAASARDACTKFGGEFVAEDIFAPLDTTDFTPYMEQIAEFGRRGVDRDLGGRRVRADVPVRQGVGRVGHHGDGCVVLRQQDDGGDLRTGGGQDDRQGEWHPVPLHRTGQRDQRLAGGAGKGALQ